MKTDIDEIKKKLIPLLETNDVDFAGIFGSFARGTFRKKSDIDLLVKFARPVSLLDLVHLEDLLSKTLNRKVDIVTEKALHPYIKDKVMSELKIVYGKR